MTTGEPSNDGSRGYPAVSPNGRYLAYTYQGYNRADLRVMDLTSGESRSLTADLDRSVSDIQWSADSKSVWIRYNDLGMARIAEVDLKGTSSKPMLCWAAQHWDAPTPVARSRSAVKTVLGRGSTSRPRADAGLTETMTSQREMSRVERMVWPFPTTDSKSRA